MTDGARILVVDDDDAIRAALRRALALAGYQPVLAASGDDALRIVRDDPPDLVVLDVMMPGIDGVETLRRLRAADSDLPVVMLTARDAVADRVAGLDAGADDYLVKPFATDELLARIRVRLRRRAATPDEALRFADLVLDPATREVRRGERSIALTATEFDLLQFFLRNPRRVLTRDQIYDAVWGYAFTGGSKVIEVYVSYLREKLEADGEPRLIQTVRGVGYVLREEP